MVPPPRHHAGNAEHEPNGGGQDVYGEPEGHRYLAWSYVRPNRARSMPAIWA